MVTSQVTDDALAHTAFDGDADAIGLDSAVGHVGLAMGRFAKSFVGEISPGFKSQKAQELAMQRAEAGVDAAKSEKNRNEGCAPICRCPSRAGKVVAAVGVKPGNGGLLVEDKDVEVER